VASEVVVGERQWERRVRVLDAERRSLDGLGRVPIDKGSVETSIDRATVSRRDIVTKRTCAVHCRLLVARADFDKFRQYEFAVDDLDSFVDKQLSVHVVDVSHK
jgi:hypothetical protein